MSKKDTFSNRRHFLKSSVVAGASVSSAMSAQSVFAQNKESGFLEIDPWTKTQGSTFVNPPYGLPSKYEKPNPWCPKKQVKGPVFSLERCST